MTTFADLIHSAGITRAALEQHLDALDARARIEQVTALTRRDQIALWSLVEQGGQLELSYFTPPSAGKLVPYPFEGRNSLPVFNRFQKVFYLDKANKLCGFNRIGISPLIGPGYYTCRQAPGTEGREVQIDYTCLPEEHPEGVMPIRSNDGFPSMFIYGGMKDNLRRVSKDVVVGRAFKGDMKPMNAWFVLCRT